MKRFLQILALILVVSLISLSFVGCKKKENPTKDNNTEQLEALGMTNIDGTPIEVEPYEKESGEPYVNEDGYPVYHVRNTYDENGDPVLVVKTLNVDEDGKVIFKLQKIENGVIKDAYEEEDPQGTTTFLGNPDAIPSADDNNQNKGNDNNPAQSGDDNNNQNQNQNQGDNQGQNSAQDTTKGDDNGSASQKDNGSSGSGDNKTVNGDEILTDNLIKLGGVWGNVKKTERDNVYRGNLVETKLEKLKEEKTYAGINATFDKGIYIPATIKAEDGTVYKVRQVAYTRLYVYYDNWEEDYDWFTERGIFKPNRDDDPLVYIEDNDTFELDAEYKSIHTTFLIELAK